MSWPLPIEVDSAVGGFEEHLSSTGNDINKPGDDKGGLVAELDLSDLRDERTTVAHTDRDERAPGLKQAADEHDWIV